MDIDQFGSLVALFRAQAAREGGARFLASKKDGAWVDLSWGEVARDVERIARALIRRGVRPGDRVALVAENRPEWAIADIAVMSVGAITVPVYTTNTTDDHFHILANSQAKAVVVSTKALAQRVLPAAIRASVAFAVAIEPDVTPAQGHEMVHWVDLLAEGDAADADVAAELERRVMALGRDDTACLIYTSGTGGAPRGVMLSHGNVLTNAYAPMKLLESVASGRERFLSFLPLSHAYEHTAGMWFPILAAAEVWYGEGADKLSANLAEAKPTIVTVVPRLYEVLHGRLMSELKRMSPRRRALFEETLRLGIKRVEGEPLSLVERAKDLGLGLLVRRKVKARFGGRLKALVSGGAPLNYEVGRFFLALGLPCLQGYGQTEASPLISANPPKAIRLRTVGPPLVGVEVRIAEDGEILVRSPGVMKGYWRDEATTERVVRDGWLHTGDIGHLDEEGYIVITDRMRDIIVNSGGDNVSPARVEGLLSLEPEIGQAMVHGDKRPYLVALLVPDAEFVREFAKARGVKPDAAALAEDKEFRTALGKAIERLNHGLSAIERVRSFAVVAPFTIENGQMTPTLKIRRHKIREAYQDKLEALYVRG